MTSPLHDLLLPRPHDSLVFPCIVHDNVPPRSPQDVQTNDEVQLSKSRSRCSLVLPRQQIDGNYTPRTTCTTSRGSLEPSPWGCDGVDVSPGSTSRHSPLPAPCPRVRPTTTARLAVPISGPKHEKSCSNPCAGTHFHEPSDAPPSLPRGVSCPREACNLPNSSPAREYDDKNSKASEVGEEERVERDMVGREKVTRTSMALDLTSPLSHPRQQDHDASAFDGVRMRGTSDSLAVTGPTTPVSPIIRGKPAGVAFSAEAGNSGGLLRARREIPPPSSPTGPWLSRRSGGREVLPRFRRTIPEQTPPRRARAGTSSREGPGCSAARRFFLFVPLWVQSRLRRFLGRWPQRRIFPSSSARGRQARADGTETKGDRESSSSSRWFHDQDVRKAGESDSGAAVRTALFMDHFGKIRGLVVRACFFLLAVSTMWFTGLDSAGRWTCSR